MIHEVFVLMEQNVQLIRIFVLMDHQNVFHVILKNVLQHVMNKQDVEMELSNQNLEKNVMMEQITVILEDVIEVVS